MNKNILARIAYVIILSLLSSSITGCGFIPTIGLNEEDTEIVAEYAAGLLAKYEKGHSMGLVRVDDLDMDALYATPTPTPIVPPEPLVTEETEVEYDDSLVGDDDTLAEEKEDVQITLIPLNESFGLDNCGLEFSYMERCETYPESDEQLVFAMNATTGYDLIVVHFNMTNTSGQEQTYLTNLNGYKVRFIVNGEDKYRCDFTILPNDLTSFSGKLASGETGDAILIFELPQQNEIVSLDMMLVNGSDQRNYKLYQ